MYDGRYEGGAIGDGVDPRSPDAWKRAPLVYGILGFVFMSSAVARVVHYGLWLTLVAVLVKLSLAFLKEEGVAQAGAIATLAVGVPLALTWLFSFASTMQAVIEATGNGNEEVNWPDWNFFEWFGGARFVLAATFAAGLPGAIAGAVTLAANFDKPAMAAFGIGAPPVISWMVLFPIFLYSMLIEDNPLAIFSGQALRNLKAAADGWVFTYMYSIGLMVLLGFAAGMLAADSFLVSLVGGIGLMAVFLLHARIVGRLMWYASERGAKAAVVREVGG
jgi:hypothetical protein